MAPTCRHTWWLIIMEYYVFDVDLQNLIYSEVACRAINVNWVGAWHSTTCEFAGQIYEKPSKYSLLMIDEYQKYYCTGA